MKIILKWIKKSFRHGDFYKKQRLRLDILVHNDNPLGGKWSFDEENRKNILGIKFHPKLPFSMMKNF